MLQLTGLGALSGLLVPSAAFASDSGNSSADSGNSSAGSGNSSAGSGAASNGSANASQGSADASGQSANSSNSGEASAASSEESANDSAGLVAITLVLLTTATTAGAIVLIVLLSRRHRQHKGKGGDDKPRSDAALLLDSGFINARRDLGLQLASLARTPAALDRLAAQAWAGRGTELEAMARAAGLPVPRVAAAVRTCWSAPQSAEAAARILVALLADLAPELSPDPAFVADFLWQLELERRRGAPETQPGHRALARWFGLDDPGCAAALPAAPSRAALHADPQRHADAVADALAGAFPGPVQARIAHLRREVSRLDWSLAGGLPEQAPA